MPDALRKTIAAAFEETDAGAIGVAVSGGGDSLALLHLLQEFCTDTGRALRAATVDHGLRDGSAAEAAQVARICAELGVPHQTLVWDGWTGAGNLQQAAREARYRLLAEWARGHGIACVAIGHTADDQAETFLMRLARRSGVDGLSAMTRTCSWGGVTFMRPLLDARRADLRGYLHGKGAHWVEDPSNDDRRFERVRARQALTLLADIGIDAEVLGDVATQLRDVRKALEWQTFLAAKQCFSVRAGAVVVEETALRLQPDEIQRRLIVTALRWVGGAVQGPRRAAVARLRSAMREGQAQTLEGCRIRREGDHIWIFRELQAVRDTTCDPASLWDDRWRLRPVHDGMPGPEGLRVAALTEQGLTQCPDWRDTGLPFALLQATPALWRGATVVSAPLAGFAGGWEAELAKGPDSLFAAVLSH